MKKILTILLLLSIVGGAIFYVARATPQEREAAHIERGNEYLKAGELNKARIEYKNAAKINPLNPETSYRWGLVEEAEGRVRSAYANFLRSEQQDPKFVPALLKIAHYNLVVDQYDIVNAKLSSALEIEPENAQARALQAAMYLREKKFEAAEKEARFALSKQPSNITAYSVLAGIHIAQNDIPKAETFINEGIKQNPEDISLLLLKVRLYEDPLNIDKINEAYEAIFKLKPEDASLRKVLATIYTNAGRIDDAENTLRTAVKDIPENWPLKQTLILFMSKQRSHAAAEKELQDMIVQHPKRGQLYLWLSELYIEHGKIDQAVAVLQNMVELETESTSELSAKASLARISFKKGNREIADKMIKAILEKAPTHLEARFIRATMLADDGRYQETVTLLRQIIRDKPQATEPRVLLAEVLLLQNYPDLAIETLNQLLDVAPTDTPAKIRLAQLYSQYGSPQLGYDLLQSVVKEHPNEPVVWENLARIAINMNRTLSAKEAIKQLSLFKGQQETASFLSATLASATGDNAQAFDAYKNMIAKDPNAALSEHAAFRLLESSYDTPRFEEAVQFVESLDTNSPYIKNILGESFVKLNKPEKAAEQFKIAIRQKPRTQDAYLNLARIDINAGAFDDAAELLKTAQAILESDPRANLMLASVYSRQKQYDNALAIYDVLLNKNPELDVAANNAAAIITEQAQGDKQKLKKAEALAQRFTNSKNPAYVDTLSWVYFKQGEYAKATTTIQRAIALAKTKNPDLYYHLGEIAHANKQPGIAKEALETVLAINPEYSEEKRVKELLSTL